MSILRDSARRVTANQFSLGLFSWLGLFLFVVSWPISSAGQDDRLRSLTPLQSAIEQQQLRLGSEDVEERRDALMRLASLRHPAASRIAVSALRDVSPTVRVAAAAAVLWLPPHESANALIPLLNDKDEFVRQEVAYALGKTGSRVAVAPLVELLAREKLSGPRGAAVVSLGQLGDETAVVPLAHLLAPTIGLPSGSRKVRAEQNEFVIRATARSLGQIRSRAGVPALIAALENVDNAADVRREAAIALGLIGAPESVPALRNILSSEDPYLSLAASESLRRIESQ